MAAATVDTVLDKLSRCHVVIFVFAFIRGLPVTWNLMMSVFVAPSAVEFRCADAVNETVASFSGGGHQIWTNSTAQCFSLAGTNASEPCESWVYDRSVYGKTVTEEWNMVCSNRWMVSSSQSIYLAGMVVGTVAASHISDWFGRKKTILGGIVLSVGASALTAFSTSVTMYYVSRFIVALAISGYSDVIYTLIMETVSPRFRYMPTMTMGNGWTTGMLLLPWLHYLTREWRATQLYAALPLAPLFVLGW
ncbi:solute carrier family 22 member 7-like [Dermacentor silvarum]|uniref:solute carrier family 22 member 7-like n=1 Tax=Dermacentor silvarum TaxID=543639 RepID=UPI00189A25ED|nr:solute carrier family 22 member 7-like [Dermacentor silvarum]